MNRPDTYRMSIKGAARESQIYFGGLLQDVATHLPDRVVILTDRNVYQLYGEKFPDHPVVVVEPGETSKSLDTVRMVYDRLLEHQADRSCFLLGIGGGVVCDLAGFVASTYMRGLPFGFVSTTLLSQVDASLGGKNGINFSGIKNLVGVFNPPHFVVCDFQLLKTLPPEEVRSGYGELLKAALIHDAALFTDLESHREVLFRLDVDLMHDLVWRAVSVKKGIVEKDERETGLRRLLNFGHTFGHPIEMIHGVRHGEAICHGMMIANHIAVEAGILKPSTADTIRHFMVELGLVRNIELDREKILQEIRNDKKREQERIHFVVLENIGKARVWECSWSQLDRHFTSYKGLQG